MLESSICDVWEQKIITMWIQMSPNGNRWWSWRSMSMMWWKTYQKMEAAGCKKRNSDFGQLLRVKLWLSGKSGKEWDSKNIFIELSTSSTYGINCSLALGKIAHLTIIQKVCRYFVSMLLTPLQYFEIFDLCNGNGIYTGTEQDCVFICS